MLAIVIGGGVGGLAAACLLGAKGYEVTVLEKNEQLGGRCGSFAAQGFRFDTGPSWWLMTEVFERFFKELGENISDYLQLEKLEPNFRVFYKNLGQQLDISADISKNAAQFEMIERGTGQKLRGYLADARQTYEISLSQFLYKNYDLGHDLFNLQTLRAGLRPRHLLNLHRHAAKYITDPRLQQILEYPAVFLGGSPFHTPALYSLLSHTIMSQDILYPRGGMYKLVEALIKIGKKYGVQYRTSAEVGQIIVKNGGVQGVWLGNERVPAEVVVSDAGVQFTEENLLTAKWRDRPARYWQKRRLAPSALLLYLGVDRQYASLAHHNLLFSQNWQQNFAEIFDQPQFPQDPSLYVCAPGKTDPTAAPKNHENLFVLVPIGAGAEYSDQKLTIYSEQIVKTIEREMHLPDLQKHIVYQKLCCAKDFAAQFNSPLGTGLGLAHTLRQSAAFRPKNCSQKVKNLFYVGADVHPGIGLPSALISAQLLMHRLRASS